MGLTRNISKGTIIAILFLLLAACSSNTKTHTYNIVEKGVVNKTFLQTIDAPEKALLLWYLYAYGNECNSTSLKVKCVLLKEMGITDECTPLHLNNLHQWFLGNKLITYKLKNCPNLPVKSPIQNTIDEIILSRSSDTLSIKISVRGQNETEEKVWAIKQTESFLIKGKTMQKIKSNK